MRKPATIAGMTETTFWKAIASFGGGALLAIQHIPQSQAAWYLFLAVVFDVTLSAIADKVSDLASLDKRKMIWTFIGKFFGCMIMVATIFMCEDIVKQQAGVVVTWSLTDYALAVMILWEGASVARSYRKLNLPAAERIGRVIDSIDSYLESRQQPLTQDAIAAKLEAQRQAGLPR